MTKGRANLGFAAGLENFDPADWTPTAKKTTKDRPKPDATKEAARVAGFKSREPVKTAPTKKQRRRRTGRNVQFNIKTTPETIEGFCAVADGQGWGLGETLEYAVALLKERYPAHKQPN